jgi:hypothetical protein
MAHPALCSRQPLDWLNPVVALPTPPPPTHSQLPVEVTVLLQELFGQIDADGGGTVEVRPGRTIATTAPAVTTAADLHARSKRRRVCSPIRTFTVTVVGLDEPAVALRRRHALEGDPLVGSMWQHGGHGHDDRAYVCALTTLTPSL